MMEKHSLETWYTLADADPQGTFNKLVKSLDISFSTAETILSDNNHEHLSACKYILEKYKNLIEQRQANSIVFSNPEKEYPDQPKLLSDLGYIGIGFFANIFISLAISYVTYVISLEFGLLLFIGYTIFLTYISTIGRYSKPSFYGFTNLIILSAIPIVNWSVVYYFGRGLHLSTSKQKLPNPPIATSAGIILIGCIVGIFVFLYAIDSFQITSASTNNSSPQIISTSTRISKTSTPTSNCIHWTKITVQMEGKRVCVYGKVESMYSTNDSWTRIKFSDKPNTFFINDTSFVYELKIGECISTTQKIKVYDTVPYMDVSGNLLYCESWMTNP